MSHLNLVLVSGGNVGYGPASFLLDALLVIGREQRQEVAESPVLNDDLHTQNRTVQRKCETSPDPLLQDCLGSLHWDKT